MDSEIVGYWIERETRTVSKSFEYAGAGWVGETVPGRYPIRKGSYWYSATLDAVHTESWFQNRLGAALGSNNLDTTRKPDTYGVQLDQMSLGQCAADGRVELAPGWEVVTVGTYSASSGARAGEPIYRAQLISR